jgi:copper chaperone
MERILMNPYSWGVNSFRRRKTMKKTLLRSQELSCPSCVAKIETALRSLNGVADAKVFFNSGKIEVEHDPEKVRVDELVKAIKSVGYEAGEAAF